MFLIVIIIIVSHIHTFVTNCNRDIWCMRSPKFKFHLRPATKEDLFVRISHFVSAENKNENYLVCLQSKWLLNPHSLFQLFNNYVIYSFIGLYSCELKIKKTENSEQIKKVN